MDWQLVDRVIGAPSKNNGTCQTQMFFLLMAKHWFTSLITSHCDSSKVKRHLPWWCKTKYREFLSRVSTLTLRHWYWQTDRTAISMKIVNESGFNKAETMLTVVPWHNTSNHLVIQANIGNAQFSTFRTKEAVVMCCCTEFCVFAVISGSTFRNNCAKSSGSIRM